MRSSLISGREREAIEGFTERYRVGANEAARQIERIVIGADWGANGYTTRAQADRLGDELRIEPGSRLLDLGSGMGWPGLYLASTRGARVVLADVPGEGLQAAMVRSRAEGLADRTAAVRADARSLPFAPASFDAIVHTDVLC